MSGSGQRSGYCWRAMSAYDSNGSPGASPACFSAVPPSSEREFYLPSLYLTVTGPLWVDCLALTVPGSCLSWVPRLTLLGAQRLASGHYVDYVVGSGEAGREKQATLGEGDRSGLMGHMCSLARAWGQDEGRWEGQGVPMSGRHQPSWHCSSQPVLNQPVGGRPLLWEAMG